MDQELMTSTEVGNLLGLSHWQVRRYANLMAEQPMRRGRYRLFTKADVERLRQVMPPGTVKNRGLREAVVA